MRRPDDFVSGDRPLRRIRVMVNEALAKMDALFSRMYEADIKGGRPSIAPEKLLRAMLMQILFGTRSELQLMEQTQHNMLFACSRPAVRFSAGSRLALTAHHRAAPDCIDGALEVRVPNLKALRLMEWTDPGFPSQGKVALLQ